MLQSIEPILFVVVFALTLLLIIMIKMLVYYKITVFKLFDNYKKYGNIDSTKTSFWKIYVEGIVLFTKLPDTNEYDKFYEYEKVQKYVQTITQCQTWIKRLGIPVILSFAFLLASSIQSSH